MIVRYGIKLDETGGWTVYHVTSGIPAEVEGYLQIGLEFEDADDRADLLNTLDVLSRATTAQGHCRRARSTSPSCVRSARPSFTPRLRDGFVKRLDGH
jgi:hypothetical protein